MRRKYNLDFWDMLKTKSLRSEQMINKTSSSVSKFAFTLTEVLLAVVIVGIIAALVLPALVTHYQEKGFEQAYKRDEQTIQNAIEGLAITENKATFFETMMYTIEEPESYAESSELFLKKYMRVSKLCGDNNGDCFAKKYYNYTQDHDKVVYTPEFKGSCAALKNGSSLCLTTETNQGQITGLIDVNGMKGPNVFGKDLRTLIFDKHYIKPLSKNTSDIKDTDYLVTVIDPDPVPDPDPEPDPEPECPADFFKWDLGCCQKNSSTITSFLHPCCQYSEMKLSIQACQYKDIAIRPLILVVQNYSNFVDYKEVRYCGFKVDKYELNPLVPTKITGKVQRLGTTNKYDYNITLDDCLYKKPLKLANSCSIGAGDYYQIYKLNTDGWVFADNGSTTYSDAKQGYIFKLLQPDIKTMDYQDVNPKSCGDVFPVISGSQLDP
ncbi:MAG: type II secretion system protein [Candidatus Gastranaerophilaceae bacterium]